MMQNSSVPPHLNAVIEFDKKLRGDIAQYFFALQKMNDPAKAVELLASHVAIMVEMINEFKKQR